MLDHHYYGIVTIVEIKGISKTDVHMSGDIEGLVKSEVFTPSKGVMLQILIFLLSYLIKNDIIYRHPFIDKSTASLF